MAGKAAEEPLERLCVAFWPLSERENDDVAPLEGAHGALRVGVDAHGAENRRRSDVAAEQILAGRKPGGGSEVEAVIGEAERVRVALELILRVQPVRQPAWSKLRERPVACNRERPERLPVGRDRERE